MSWRRLSWNLLLPCLVCLSQTAPRPHSAELKPNPQIYRNQAAGFCYSIPFGWVNRTEEMGAGSEAKTAQQRSEVLLAIFERPPQVQTNDVNPAVVIASEPTDAYQGLKTAADYFAPLAEVTSSHGLQMQGEPYEVAIDNHHLARGDFTKQLGATKAHQSTLVLLNKSSVLSFTFIAEGEERINSLIEELRFGLCGK